MHEPKLYFVYIIASGPRGVLYVGMTNDLAGRTWEHRERAVEGFTKRYWSSRLVWWETHDDAAQAARRERQLKRWHRDWKIALVERMNPTWADMFEEAIAGTGR